MKIPFRNRWFVTMASMVFFYLFFVVYLAANVDHPGWDILEWGLIGVVTGPVYLLPTLVGLHRRNVAAIFILNFFLGCSGIGWVAALIWAVLKEPAPEKSI